MAALIEIDSWDKLVSFLQEIQSQYPVDMAFRGHDRDYRGVMKAKVDRCLDLPPDDLKLRLRMERAICQRFREHAPIYLSAVERRYLKTPWLQLVVMQHYGAPTRLLDWTKSPWVAAYFAVFGGWEFDGYIYGFRRNKLEDSIKAVPDLKDPFWHDLVQGPHPSDMNFDKDWDSAAKNGALFDPKKVQNLSEWVTTYYCREAHFPRLIVQQSFFTFGSKPNLNHWEQITRLLKDDECFSFQIKRDAKAKILRGLNSLGLNGASLFPGVDGIGRSLEGFARAWHLDPPPSQL